MNMFSVVMIVFAFVLFVLAGFNVGGKFNLIGFGLACLTLGLWLPQFWK
jgi:hypothetical protein